MTFWQKQQGQASWVQPFCKKSVITLFLQKGFFYFLDIIFVNHGHRPANDCPNHHGQGISRYLLVHHQPLSIESGILRSGAFLLSQSILNYSVRFFAKPIHLQPEIVKQLIIGRIGVIKGMYARVFTFKSRNFQGWVNMIAVIIVLPVNRIQ
jgi:hypothetical protein